MLQHYVTAVNGTEAVVVFVEHEQPLGSHGLLAALFADPCVALFDNSSGVKVFSDMLVLQHMSLVVQQLCVPSFSSSSSLLSSLSSSQPPKSMSTVGPSSSFMTSSAQPSSSQENTLVWIDFDGSLVVSDKEQAKDNISVILSNITGTTIVVVELTTDTNGRLTQVVVAVPGGEEEAKLVIDTIKETSEKGTDDLLNRVLDAGLVVGVSIGTPTVSGAAVLVVVLLCDLVRLV